MPFTFYHLLLGEKPHHFKNCLLTGEQTSPPDWDVRQRPVFWRGKKSRIVERLESDGLAYDPKDCIFLPGGLCTLSRFLREIQSGQNALIIHGVPHRLFWFVLRTAPAILPRAAWIGWGAGVTNPWRQREAGMSVAKRIWFSAYDYCVPRLGVVSTQSLQELALLESMVGPLSNHLPARYLLQGLPERFEPRTERRPIRICVGHRAGELSEYEEAFGLLHRFADGPIDNLSWEVHVPLSYGNLDIVPRVIALGQQKLGAAFRPLTGFMSLSDYLEFLRNTDILVMPHTKAQAGFNCTFGLTVGSRVFLRPENTFLQRYRQFGCHLFEMSELSSQGFETLAQPLPEEVQRANFAGIQSMLESNREAWFQLYSRLVPTCYQGKVAECTG